jgi:hypothetical protein
MRTGASGQLINSKYNNDSDGLNTNDFKTAAIDLTGAIDIKCTGEGVLANDIVQRGMTVKWFPV